MGGEGPPLRASVLEIAEEDEPTPEEAVALADELEKRLRSLESAKDAHLVRVARMKLEGFTNHEIAGALRVSERSIERKIDRIQSHWIKEEEATAPLSASRDAYMVALEGRRRLAADNPTVVEYQSTLARTHANLGDVLISGGDDDAARDAYEAALAIRRGLANTHPDWSDNSSSLGGLLNNIAIIDLIAGRFAEGRDRVREAIAWQEKALAADPRNRTYRQFLRNHYTNLKRAAQGLDDAGLTAEAERGLAEIEGQ